MRRFVPFAVENPKSFSRKLFRWLEPFSKCLFLDSNSGNPETILGTEAGHDCIAATGAVNELCGENTGFEELKSFYEKHCDWLFGCIPYASVGLHFFQPEYVFLLRKNKFQIGYLSSISSEEKVLKVFKEILHTESPAVSNHPHIIIQQGVTKEEYIETAERIKKHIQRGDIYEMNYCIEFFAADAVIHPAEVFLRLNEKSQTPFSAFYRNGNQYLLCASPERFLKKVRKKIISQPIKGTIRRGKNEEEDAALKNLLLQSEKERSENVMIVDLVRNDLSRTCTRVQVEELCGIYSFPLWHQMISTVSGEMKQDVHFTEVIQNAFPMGSMTGAPKIRAMELIEKFENTKRGWYSGSVGYITPPVWEENEDAAFDFNVVIRSIVYNGKEKAISFHAGSAITANSVPEKEYEECLLKAKGMLEALNIRPFREPTKQFISSKLVFS